MDRMDGMDMDASNAIKVQEPPKLTKKIGATTYEVSIHFSKTSTETMTDKIMRLIRNDCANSRFD